MDPTDDGGAPLIAIVGRPNVGKSRLFNRMTGTQFAIVEDMPGVTRDRQYGDGRWGRRRYQVVDTGGFEPESRDELLRQMREQARLAIEEADVILFLVDGMSGLVPADAEIAHMLRETRKPVFTVVNKIDGDRHEANVPEFYALGAEHLFALSAEHGRNYADLMDAVTEGFREGGDRVVEEDRVRVAVVGKPNAGKSSLINRMLGEDRLLTSDIPGTTRDAINTHVEFEGRRYLFIDTAGVRRKRSISMTVEKYSVVQAFKAVDRADVVLYVLDATEPISGQDQRLAGLVADKGRGLVILLNKWDIVEKDHRTADEVIKQVREEFKFHPNAPVITISALTGQRAHRILPAVDAVFAQFTRRIGTGELNRWVEATLKRNPPKSTTGQRLKIYYVSQVATRPPTFMFVVNQPDAVHFSYQRYLVNALRDAYGFEGVPVKVFFRARGKREDAAHT
ncbi:MAG: ribosome biogenesis GTPase Der [Myxococcales bacterium]|nr:ribosome biogenesis GTPase Der [Myxococcales bacterium]MCB9521600.1 ribosome biogenesis GTPase Der [Myxococcales bacterium]MCB9532406.1 ribosome biogenesis GTPase Der [Myxococcales bacterium]